MAADTIRNLVLQVNNRFDEACSDESSALCANAATLREQLEDSYSRFRLWSGTSGAHHRAKDTRSLHYRLRKVPEVKDRLVELLTGLERYIVHGESDDPPRMFRLTFADSVQRHAWRPSQTLLIS